MARGVPGFRIGAVVWCCCRVMTFALVAPPLPARSCLPRGGSRLLMSSVGEAPPSYEEALAQAKGMRLAQLQSVLKEMGVSTRGMIEKPELVEAYAKAIVNGPPARDGAAAAAAGADDDDGPVRELKTTKMTSDKGDDAGNAGGPNVSGFPNMGGFGGLDLGSILSGLGGGAGFGGGAGGPSNMSLQTLLQRAMGKPELMAAIQKAAQNPRTMAAIQDVMQNGPGAANKYANDPEIKSLLDQLRSIM
mmetsp:Transcript_7173/g.21884  ORF Transcript_7173/g.21884 Transcript_7173/m.21884 type:complete len:247 (+) Transcript_7173:70-810(+)